MYEYNRHPNDVPAGDLQAMYDYHYGLLDQMTKERIRAGADLRSAVKAASHECSRHFMAKVPESTDHGAAWHNWHMDVMDEYARNHGLIKEDVPTNSMAGGNIAGKPMGLGGIRTHLVKREILSTVLGRVRARMRTKR